MPEVTRPLKHVEHAMGTVFSFDIRDQVTPSISSALAAAARSLHEADAVFSTYKPDSAISRLDRGEIALADCPPDVADVLELCREAGLVSEGWFSHTAAGRLDPSGLVKGWAVGRASQILHSAGARNTCVNGGGDIQLRGEAAPGTAWQVGISDPRFPGRLLTAVSGRDLAVATSGTAERGRHVLDPHTGVPAEGLSAVTVIGPDIAEADGHATAACAMGLARARKWIAGLRGYEALMVTEKGTVWRSAGFPSGRLTTRTFWGHGVWVPGERTSAAGPQTRHCPGRSPHMLRSRAHSALSRTGGDPDAAPRGRIGPVSARPSPVITVGPYHSVLGAPVQIEDPQTSEAPGEVAAPSVPWLTIVRDDPVNLMSYVSHVFQTYFGYSETKAHRLMLDVHLKGRAVVSSGTREEMERDVQAMHGYGLWATLQQGD